MHSAGDRVLCVRSGWGSFRTRPNPWGVRWPTRGRLYTIRACWQSPSELWWVYLHEVVNGNGGQGVEPYFMADQFVPVKRVDTEATLSALRGLLAPSRDLVPAGQNFDEMEAEERPRRER